MFMGGISTQKISKLVSDSYTRITKPVIEQVVTILLKELNVHRYLEDESSTNIYYFDELETVTKLQDDKGRAKVSHNRCDVKIETVTNPKEIDNSVYNFKSDMLSNVGLYHDNDRYGIFTDSKYGIYLLEYPIPYRVNLSIGIQVKNRELADNVNSAIYSKFMNQKTFQYRNLEYYYNIPEFILITLFELFKMRRESLNVNFLEYLRLGSNSNIDIVVDKTTYNEKDNNFDQIALNIYRKNVFSMGSLKSDLKSPDGDNINKLIDRYRIEFEYSILFERPFSLSLNYPLVINNKMIPKYLISSSTENIEREKEDDTNNYLYKESKGTNLFLYSQNQNWKKRIYKTIIHPKQDTLLPFKIILSYYHIPVFQGIIECSYTINGTPYLDLDIPNEVFPLVAKYHDVSVWEDVFKTQGDRSKHQYSLMPIILYNVSEKTIVDKRKIEITDDFRIIVNDIDDSCLYKVLISINSHLYMMDKDLIFKALEHHDYFEWLIRSNLNILLMNRYIELEEVPRDKRESFFDDINYPKYTKGHVYPGTEVKGDEYGTHFIFRIGNLIIRPRRTS